MKKEDVKQQAEEYLMALIQFINKNEKDEEERTHRIIELACSLVTCTVNFDEDEKTILEYINDTCKDMRDMCMIGAIRCINGDYSNVKQMIELEDEEHDGNH